MNATLQKKKLQSELDKAILNVKEGECQELRYIGGYDELSGSLDMSIKCLVKKKIIELLHVVQARAEGPKAPSPGQHPGY